jgi:hypothetical protein
VVYARLVIADTGSADMGFWTVLVQRLVGSNFWCMAAITAPCRAAQLPLEMECVDRPGGIAHHHEFKVVNLTSETISARARSVVRRPGARPGRRPAALRRRQLAGRRQLQGVLLGGKGPLHWLAHHVSKLLPALIIRCLVFLGGRNAFSV